MQLRAPLLVFLLLALAPSTTHAADELFFGANEDGASAAHAQLLRSLEGLHGYALVERLDELAASPEFALLFAEACRTASSLDTVSDLALDSEAFTARLEFPALRHLVGRIYNTLVATVALLPSARPLELESELEDSQSWIDMLDVLADLRLEPIDLDALHRRGEELRAARASLREAQDALPGFRLPPEPGLHA